MDNKGFIDYYELLQLSPNADTETIERVFRHLAKKFHPDHPDSADDQVFMQIVEAHKVLVDPEARAAYDVKYEDFWQSKWRLAAEVGERVSPGQDKDLRDQLLVLLYVQRRRNMRSPGLGEHEMSRLLQTPPELIEFHIWYLRAKGWVERLETGHLAITAEGVDQAEEKDLPTRSKRLLEGPAAKT